MYTLQLNYQILVFLSRGHSDLPCSMITRRRPQFEMRCQRGFAGRTFAFTTVPTVINFLTTSTLLSPSISIVADTGQRQYTSWRKDTVGRAWQRKATSPAYPYLGILVLRYYYSSKSNEILSLTSFDNEISMPSTSVSEHDSCSPIGTSIRNPQL